MSEPKRTFGSRRGAGRCRLDGVFGHSHERQPGWFIEAFGFRRNIAARLTHRAGFGPNGGDGRQRSTQRGFGPGAADEVARQLDEGFGWKASSETTRWRREGTNATRGSAPGTVYGHAVGEKLCRVQPHERIRHETRPAGSRWMKQSVERSRKPEDASARVRQARAFMLLLRAGIR
jgi:hypothetical protein